jgi:hypothetical protein
LNDRKIFILQLKVKTLQFTFGELGCWQAGLQTRFIADTLVSINLKMNEVRSPKLEVCLHLV